jgi:hypothetical protein
MMSPNLYILRRFVDPRAVHLADFVERVESGTITLDEAFAAKEAAGAGLQFAVELRNAGAHRDEVAGVLRSAKQVLDAARGAVELYRVYCRATRH